VTLSDQLFEIDKIDTDLELLQSELVSLRQRQVHLPELDEGEKRLSKLRGEERERALRQHSQEGDLSDLEAKIARDQSRLYGGVIVDSRELGSLEKELETYRAQRSQMENDVLLSMEDLESLRTNFASMRKKTEELRVQWEAEKPLLVVEIEKLESELAALRLRRDEIARALDSRSLALYTKLRANLGHALSNVTAGVCQWCRVVIPAKDIQHARAGILVTCTNCGRILHA
jgi:uncharacterized protein